jgi:hypothetical protein
MSVIHIGNLSAITFKLLMPLSILAIAFCSGVEAATAEEEAATLGIPEPTSTAELETKRVTISSQPVRKKPRKKSTFVPPGFENLLEPQTTEIDVYFGSLFLISTLASYTPTDITLLTPETVIARIPDLLDPEKVLSILGDSMPTNSEYVCLKDNQSDCGNLTTSSVEIIFDENRFRVDLFIAPELLAIRSAGIDKFLPPSSSGASLLHQMNVAYTGLQGGQDNYNISGSTTFAIKETRVLALSNITRDENLTIDTLAVGREYSGKLYQAGVFRSSPASLVFVNETDFIGVTIGSSLDTRKDLDQSAGNEIQVFLDSRSRVDILKDDRLISTALYDAGNQILDTTLLPGGAYDVVLRIKSSFGRVREETRFYVKTHDIPPMDHTLYFVDFGELVVKELDRTLPTGTGESFLRAGINKRLTADFGGQLGFMKQEKNTVFEAGIFKLGRYYDLNLNFGAGNNNDTGLNLNARVRAGRTTLNTNIRRTWIDNDQSLMGQETIQGNINFSFPLGRGLFTITGRYNEQVSQTDKNVGLRYDFPIYQFGRSTLDIGLSVTKDNGNLLALFGFSLRQIRGNWRSEISSQYYNDKQEFLPDDSGFVNNVNTSWFDGDRFVSDVTWNVRATDDRENQFLETDIEIISDRGRLNVDSAYSLDQKKFNYGANFNTTFIINKNSMSLGGRTPARSALVMNVEGDVKDAFFDVEVNGAVRGSAKIGSKTVVGILPYQTYEVKLIPRGDTIVDFEDQAQTVTLYPGNVITMDFVASRVIVAFGQIVDEADLPVSNALIKGVTGLATTDEFGLFQAEIELTTRELQVQTRTRQCRVQLPVIETEDLVVSLEELVCISSDGSDTR